MSRLRLTASMACVVLTFTGCGGDRRPQAAIPRADSKIPVPAAVVAPAEGPIQAVTEFEGTLLVEIGLGSGAGIEVGSLLRVNSTVADRPTFKGMVQVTEVIGPQRALARAIGLTDTQNPPAVGDRVRVADLGSAYTDFRRDLARERETTAKTDQKNDDTYLKLRENYQNELALSAGRFAEQREADRAQDAREREALAAAHDAEIGRLQAEHAGALAVLRIAMTQEALKNLDADRAERAQRLTAMQNDITTLRTNADRLGAELLITRQAAVDLQREMEKQRDHQQREVRAEVETREVLQAQLAAITATSGTTSAPATVLSRDPGRSETVLARLERTAQEQAQTQAKLTAAEIALTSARTQITTLSAELTTAKQRVSDLEAAAIKAGTASEALFTTERELTAAREQVTQHELARLEAERMVFDIAARLLAADSDTAVDTLRERLRQHIANTQNQVTAPDVKRPQ